MRPPDLPPGRRESESPSGPPGTLQQLGRYAGHGLTIALSTGLFAWLGLWLDDRLGTEPLLVTVGAFVGFGAGFYSMYRDLVLEGPSRGPGGSTGEPSPPSRGREGKERGSAEGRGAGDGPGDPAP